MIPVSDPTTDRKDSFGFGAGPAGSFWPAFPTGPLGEADEGDDGAAEGEVGLPATGEAVLPTTPGVAGAVGLPAAFAGVTGRGDFVLASDKPRRSWAAYDGGTEDGEEDPA